MMDRSAFNLYSTEFAALWDISYEDLKQTVYTYPFSANLHYLLLIKSKIANHPEYNFNLATAAAYSKDRGVLYELVDALNHDNLEDIVVEEVLELVDLKSLELVTPAAKEQVLEPVVIEAASVATRQSDTDNIRPLYRTPQYDIQEEDHGLSIAAEAGNAYTTPPKKEEKTKRRKALTYANQENDAARIDELAKQLQEGTYIQEEDKQHQATIEGLTSEVNDLIQKVATKPKRKITKKKIAPQPKSKFESWADAKETLFKEETKQVQEIVTGSIQKKNDTVSETLAKILEKQGHYSQAIEMYKQLSLHFPEKSSFFAAKIDNLKKL